MKYSTYLILGIFLILASLGFSTHAQTEGPWRLDHALKTPDWLSITGQHRTRIESIDNQFRRGRDGGDQALLFRTDVKAETVFNQLKFVMEMQDSRAELVDSGSPLSTSVVNPLELLEGSVTLTSKDLFMQGSTTTLRAGRLTMNVGKRRFVARNVFRNTANAYTGVDWQWRSQSGSQIRAFYTLPVQRTVDGPVLDNDPAFDKEHDDVAFWGLFYSPSTLPWNGKGEVYLFGLNEDDVPGRSTRNRDLLTAGFRLYRPATKNQFDYELEAVYQWGESRSSTLSLVDLDHSAWFTHFEIGYTFDTAWSPQLLFQYDYASGDDDPADGENNRFDTLFGARRFDYGPTSQFGPFVRANLNTPGLRLRFKPTTNITSFIGLRGFWLADSNDAWPVARISNSPGVSDSYIGTQLEGRVRFNIFPQNIRIEVGGTYLVAGDVMENAGKSDSTYIYTQAVLWF